MLTLDEMRQLRAAYTPYASVTERDVLARIGNPSRDVLIDTALEGLQSDDRNVRVLMLRVLAGQSGAKAMRGIQTGLNDPKRRVREVAIKSSATYHSFSEITDRLKAIVADEREKRKIRGLALSALAAGIGPLAGELTEGDVNALESLMKLDVYRAEILFGLLRLDLTGHVEDLLKEFVRNGTKEEAVMATRALCGYRVVHIDIFEHDKATQQHIMQTCDIAAGRAWYWMKRADYDALTASEPGS